MTRENVQHYHSWLSTYLPNRAIISKVRIIKTFWEEDLENKIAWIFRNRRTNCRSSRGLEQRNKGKNSMQATVPHKYSYLLNSDD